MARSGAALSFAVLLAIFEIGSCLRCYQCNSQSDPSCADPFTGTKYLVDCSTPESINYNRNYLRDILPRDFVDGVHGAPRYCHKFVLQSGTTIRTCLDANPSDLNHTCRLLDIASKNSPTDVRKQLKHCSVCNTESCNGAGSLVASLPLAALALIASYFYYKQ